MTGYMNGESAWVVMVRRAKAKRSNYIALAEGRTNNRAKARKFSTKRDAEGFAEMMALEHPSYEFTTSKVAVRGGPKTNRG